MLAALDSSIKARKPIVVTVWHPHWAYSHYHLKDPQDAMGKGEQLHAIGRSSFGADFPALGKITNNLTLTDDQLGSLEDMIQQAPRGQEMAAAGKWADHSWSTRHSPASDGSRGPLSSR